MKKSILLAAGAAICITGSAMAGTVRDNCGCGLGTMALGGEEGLVSHVIATFLNNISGNQTFGVTSGTLDCDQSTEIVSTKAVKEYITANMDAVAYDLASGEGQALNALADLMQLPDESRQDVYARWQENFDGIFSHDAVTADDVATKLAKLI